MKKGFEVDVSSSKTELIYLILTKLKVCPSLIYLMESKITLCLCIGKKMRKTVEKMSQLLNYKEFNSVLEIEEKMYLNLCKNRNNMSIIAKFKSSTLSKLEIEKGWTRNIEKSLRICK